MSDWLPPIMFTKHLQSFAEKSYFIQSLFLGLSFGIRFCEDNQTLTYFLLVFPLRLLSSVDVIKCFSSYSHVNHDPFHNTPDTKEQGQEPVRPKSSFSRYET